MKKLLGAGVFLFFIQIGLPTAHAAETVDKTKWDAVVTAAKKEGKLVVAGPQSKIWNGALEAFEKDYPDIRIEVSPFIGTDFWPRSQKEREVGKNLWDLRIGGVDPTSWKLKQDGAFAPIRPMFMTAEALDERNWRGGFENMFLDNEKQFMPTFCAQTYDSVMFNLDYIQASEFTSFASILDPKWKGKIVIDNPLGGSASATLAVIYDKYGPDFVRKLFQDQEAVISKNPRQVLDWFFAGKYPIAIGFSTGALEQFRQNNARINISVVQDLKQWNPSVCAIMAFESRPHPNATTVFMNWLFSAHAQKQIMGVVKMNSRRTTVDPEATDRVIDYTRLESYFGGPTERFQTVMEQSERLVRTLVP